jgi:N-acetylmuramoyl-L-alanine amidase
MNYTPRRSTDFIAVHCSATPPGADVDESEIRVWHQARGWQDIGYNVVIPRDGSIQVGRPIDYQGAHVEGHNHCAVGVCMVGGVNDGGQPENNFTAAQFEALLIALRFLRRYAPKARIQGHRDFPNVAKACPSFDVRAWLATVAPDLL